MSTLMMPNIKLRFGKYPFATFLLDTNILVAILRHDCFVTAEDRQITCLSFDGLEGVQGSKGISVDNTDVKIVSGPHCKHGDCAEFCDESVLQIPYFSNNYDHFKQFSVSFFYRLDGGPIYQVRILYGSII